jgi:hypothetical protein
MIYHWKEERKGNLECHLRISVPLRRPELWGSFGNRPEFSKINAQLVVSGVRARSGTVFYPSVFAVGGYKSKHARALRADVPPELELKIKILLQAERPTCPTGLLLKCAERPSFKQLIQGMQLNLILLRKMSVAGWMTSRTGTANAGRLLNDPPLATRSSSTLSGSSNRTVSRSGYLRATSSPVI